MIAKERAEAFDCAETIADQLIGFEESRSIMDIPRAPLMAALYVGFHMTDNTDIWIAQRLPHDEGIFKIDLLLEAIEEIGNCLAERLIDELKGASKIVSEKGPEGLLEEFQRQATANAELEYQGKPLPPDRILCDIDYLMNVNLPILGNTPHENDPDYKVRARYEELVARYVLKHKKKFEEFRSSGYPTQSDKPD